MIFSVKNTKFITDIIEHKKIRLQWMRHENLVFYERSPKTRVFGLPRT